MESRKEDPKQGGSEHTALFDATVDREFLRFRAVKLDRGLHVVVESHEDGQKRVWAPQALQDGEQAWTADRVESLHQVNKDDIERALLLNALFL